MSQYVLALDFGHGGGRAIFLDLDSGKRFFSHKGWSYYSPEDDTYRKEFIPDDFFLGYFLFIEIYYIIFGENFDNFIFYGFMNVIFKF